MSQASRCRGEFQQTALLIGIVIALVLRGIFIAVGAAAINQFSWVFYLFGMFLIYTAIELFKQGEMDEEDYKENRIVTWAKRAVPIIDQFEGDQVMVRKEHGKRMFTPMFIVMVAIGSTDLLFALDSIPAIYGLTQEPYIVFTANVFALMGLRQLYFLLGGLLQRLVYLTYGLSFILAFIGVKLILDAMHLNELPFINGGEPIAVGARDPHLGVPHGHRGNPWRDHRPPVSPRTPQRPAPRRSPTRSQSGLD